MHYNEDHQGRWQDDEYVLLYFVSLSYSIYMLVGRAWLAISTEIGL